MLTSILKRVQTSAFIFVITCLALCSCQKEYSNEKRDLTYIQTDLTTTVKTSVNGFVTDENNLPVFGAAVQAGIVNTTTDKFGYFEVKNADLVKNAAVVTVVKSGYFKAIKTFTGNLNKTAFFRIKLIPKTNAGIINAAVGGDATLSNGLKISLPANGVINAVTKATYTGSVYVAASFLDPTSNDINNIMPGDLRGINATGSLKGLNSFGMAAVELTGASGELLQIATGKKATVSFPIPAALISAAPSSIPLWYFNETIGLWKEDGSAIKTGNMYIGSVSHFSYWNCDAPFNLVPFSCSIVDASGHPVPDVAIKISIIGGSGWYSSSYGYTDSSGFSSGSIPANAQLLLEVYTDYFNGCTSPVYTQPFNSGITPVSLGNISIGNTNIAYVTGTITDCIGAPVTNGYVLMQRGYYNYRYSVDNTGTFSFTTALCGSNAVTLVGFDVATQQQSAGNSYTLTIGNNPVGNLQACGISTQQFLNYTINGTNYSFTNPPDSILQYVNYNFNPVAITVMATNIGNGLYRSATMDFTSTGIAQGSVQTLLNFSPREIIDSFPTFPAIPVNITEYGTVGQFISGNFSGTITGAPPANIVYAITCNFRVRRQQ